MDKIDLGRILGNIEGSVNSIEKGQKADRKRICKMERKVSVIHTTLRNHRLIASGISLFSASSGIIAWELSKEWVKAKLKTMTGQ